MTVMLTVTSGLGSYFEINSTYFVAYDEHNTTISRELEKLKHGNALLHSGTVPPLD
jgi:hypothetical protein